MRFPRLSDISTLGITALAVMIVAGMLLVTRALMVPNATAFNSGSALRANYSPDQGPPLAPISFAILRDLRLETERERRLPSAAQHEAQPAPAPAPAARAAPGRRGAAPVAAGAPGAHGGASFFVEPPRRQGGSSAEKPLPAGKLEPQKRPGSQPVTAKPKPGTAAVAAPPAKPPKAKPPKAKPPKAKPPKAKPPQGGGSKGKGKDK